MMTLANTTVGNMLVSIKRANPMSSHHKENFFPFFSLFLLYLRRWVLAEPIVVTILQYALIQTIMLHALNLYREVGQLFPNNSRKNEVFKAMEEVRTRWGDKERKTLSGVDFCLEVQKSELKLKLRILEYYVSLPFPIPATLTELLLIP